MESRILSKEPNDYFSDEEIAESKQRFPKSDRIHKLIARLEASERLAELKHFHEPHGWCRCKQCMAYEAWRKSAGRSE